eukprot:TRINITY_DN14308_c0_g1_i1.p1 TRINITY_DN14308_c0_g1~~TRINITY_DN14308_c0_g1_i1.p1  ORF type:complete len:160 (+),score=12.13 TRINITY_DN14308_c0_g1_i1:110-589(+)
MSALLGRPDLDEDFLFHGSPLDTVDDICRSGFDPRRAGEFVGRMFGVASYFAVNSSKADVYTGSSTSRLQRQAERRLLVVRAVLGEPHHAKEPMKKSTRPPDDCDGQALGYVVAERRIEGGAVDHTEVMIYDKGQALPVAIVTYVHQKECACAACHRRR